jgi:hypothetical protein
LAPRLGGTDSGMLLLKHYSSRRFLFTYCYALFTIIHWRVPRGPLWSVDASSDLSNQTEVAVRNASNVLTSSSIFQIYLSKAPPLFENMSQHLGHQHLVVDSVTDAEKTVTEFEVKTLSRYTIFKRNKGFSDDCKCIAERCINVAMWSEV